MTKRDPKKISTLSIGLPIYLREFERQFIAIEQFKMGILENMLYTCQYETLATEPMAQVVISTY